MEEIWRDIPGYEGLYQVSNFGLVRRDGKIRAYGMCRGYPQVSLCKNGSVRMYYVHRLVAEVFVPNPNRYPIINHKDENPLNSRADNLEWCTYSYNMSYGSAQENKERAVEQLLDGVVVKRWKSMAEAQRAGYSQGNISLCCCGQRRSHKGYEWRFAI